MKDRGIDEKNLDREITLFSTDTQYKEAVEPIGQVAQERGYKVTMTDDLSAKAEIGIYCQHSYEIPSVNSKLSVIMFHGLDMGYTEKRWPQENWSRFDIGLLPGQVSVNNWKKASAHPYARPTIGVFEVGWPKADSLFSESFSNSVNEYQEQIGLGEGQTILYAPTKESPGQIDDFVSAARGLADNLLIKHAPYEYDRELEQIYEPYRNEDEICFADKRDRIMYSLSLSDILVSDESSVLQEALLTNTVPISVIDWPKHEPGKDRTYNQLPEFTITTKKENLRDTLEDIISNREYYAKELEHDRQHLVKNLGTSSEAVVDLIESVVGSEQLAFEPVPPATDGYSTLQKLTLSGKTALSKPYHHVRHRVLQNLTEEQEQTLKKLKFDKMLHTADRMTNYKKYR